MKRFLASCLTLFESASPDLNSLYWLSLWSLPVMFFLERNLRSLGFGVQDLLEVDRGCTTTPGGTWEPVAPGIRFPAGFLDGAFAMAFLWLVLVGWTAWRMEQRLRNSTQPVESETSGQRRGIRWMLRIAIGAAWFIPVAAAVLPSLF